MLLFFHAIIVVNTEHSFLITIADSETDCSMTNHPKQSMEAMEALTIQLEARG
jgi:hypothetical protein